MGRYRPKRISSQSFYGGAARALVAAHQAANRYNRVTGGTKRKLAVDNKSAFKGKGSRTVTKRRRKNQSQNNSQHNHAGKSGYTLRFSSRKYSPKILKFITGVHYLVTEDARYLTCSSTNCNYMHNSILDKSELNNIYNAAAKLLQVDGGGTTSETTVTSGGTSKDFKVYIASGTAEYRIKNNGQHPVEMIIYCYKTKIDNTVGPQDMLSTSTNSTSGFGSGNLTSATDVDYQDVCLFPTDSPILLRHYQIMEQHKVTLMPGEIHTYRVFSTWNKVASTSMKFGDGDTARDPYHFKGYTGGVMFRISGYPVHSFANDAVGLSSGRIDVVGIKRYKFRAMSTSRTTVNYFPSQTQVTDAEYMDVASGNMEKVSGGVVSTSTNEV